MFAGWMARGSFRYVCNNSETETGFFWQQLEKWLYKRLLMNFMDMDKTKLWYLLRQTSEKNKKKQSAEFLQRKMYMTTDSYHNLAPSMYCSTDVAGWQDKKNCHWMIYTSRFIWSNTHMKWIKIKSQCIIFFWKSLCVDCMRSFDWHQKGPTAALTLWHYAIIEQWRLTYRSLAVRLKRAAATDWLL